MIYYLIAFLMGVAITFQAGVNASLAKSLNSTALVAGFISLFIGAFCIGSVALFKGDLNLSLFKELASQEWWKFLGGILGAFFLFATILLAPKIGFANMFILALVGQLLTSFLLDSFGIFGEAKSISFEKILGLCLLLVSLLIFYAKDLFSRS
ncbi:hypothetical protein DMB92_00410 [Campylobacter sp. MIT 99-7217]|uniref:DMT family transporter n=1 Tax=Campylobacter sp. MIT 99-7217 TaxID=535091 RepID=UPI00115C3C75|nr:DMT family transporter [Campylobacter sp. MIT 99-7217]TQR34461.1 hypothetical protein DMB92_00410 [Campylobacter sp. MIT 99-7217]